MRGKASSKYHPDKGARITPAYAGKRLCFNLNSTTRRDHPRVCGEKSVPAWHSWYAPGSPPRMRGKVYSGERYEKYNRITPAYAGKRPAASAPVWGQRDHPRVCGEKKASVITQADRLGSPPRMRGKASSPSRWIRGTRITPAYAGKRIGLSVFELYLWDHPRVCGEKASDTHTDCKASGSPPRMRGKEIITFI